MEQFLSPVVCNTKPGWMNDAILSSKQFSDLVKRWSCASDAWWVIGEHEDSGSVVLQGSGFPGPAEDFNSVLIVVQFCDYGSGFAFWSLWLESPVRSISTSLSIFRVSLNNFETEAGELHFSCRLSTFLSSLFTLSYSDVISPEPAERPRSMSDTVVLIVSKSERNTAVLFAISVLTACSSDLITPNSTASALFSSVWKRLTISILSEESISAFISISVCSAGSDMLLGVSAPSNLASSGLPCVLVFYVGYSPFTRKK